MAGFECTDKLNAFGNRVDFLELTGHYQHLADDYLALHPFNMTTVREGIRWSRVEKQPNTYDWEPVKKMMAQSKESGIQIIWDLCHFGYPDDLTPLHPMFARRFAALCRNFVMMYREIYPNDELIVTPINEVSFISWLGGDVAGTSPWCFNHGWHVKYALMRAYIEGIEAMREVDARVRIMTTEPLIHIVAPHDAAPELVATAALRNDEQFQVLEILSGAMCPELRGKPEYVDIIGVNYYFNNQWETGSNRTLDWLDKAEDRTASLHQLVGDLYQRYKRPIVLSETSHPGEHRAQWMDMIADECAHIVNMQIPLWGICWYPVLDRPDWDHLDPWHRSGLWDRDHMGANPARSVLHQPVAASLLRAQALIQTARHRISGR